jgi:hypothetical protein
MLDVFLSGIKLKSAFKRMAVASKRRCQEDIHKNAVESIKRHRHCQNVVHLLPWKWHATRSARKRSALQLRISGRF